MRDLYLKFASEAEAQALLYTTGEDGEVRPNYTNTDVLGVLYEPTGEVDADGMPIMVPLAGWHVNIRLVSGEDAGPLEPFEVHPTQPRRVWA
jgi:hypothetical protein